MTQILERDEPLAQIRQAFDRVEQARSGVCVLLCGQAGMGKTTLVRGFVNALGKRVTVLQCGCEALLTPRPLGPLFDLAPKLPPALDQALHHGLTYGGLFPSMLRHFADSSQAQVLVVEDVHWADAGTLDLLRYVGRRLDDVPLLMLLTYRAEGLDADHPLRGTLGELPASSTLRISLQPLSRGAVDGLARSGGRDGGQLHRITGGNPFFVTELLASPADAVPVSVRDAVLAQLARVSAAARALANTVSLFPNRVERELLASFAPLSDEAVCECLVAGLLVAEASALSFRHELVRNAVYDEMPAALRIDGHARAFRALGGLQDGGEELARRVHHAEAAGLRADIARLAPRAARQAASTGDHREAARLYGLALQNSAPLDPASEGDLLEAQAHEWMLTNRHRAAIDCRERAREVHALRGDRLRDAVNLRWLARLHWYEHGTTSVALRLARQAIELLEALPDKHELALAYSSMSHICLGGDDLDGAQLWGLRAIELAETIDDAEALCHALTNVGSARLRLHDDAMAWERLHRSLTLAQAHGFEQDAARAYINLFILCVVHHDFTLGLKYAQEGIAYCEARGLDLFTVRMRIRRAFAHVVMGQWELADADLAHLAERHRLSPMEASTRDFVAGVLAMRRGDAGAAHGLSGIVEPMVGHRVELWFISSAAALAEAAWLEGRTADIEGIARPALARFMRLGDRWRCGELLAWLQRASCTHEPAVPDLPLPYALEARGDWRAAAHAWNRLGCPYDRALALLAGGEPGLRESLAVFEALGARPAAERVRQLLHDLGVRAVPRGPQPRTRDDPLGLTAREREIFELARRGVPAGEIAQRLHRSLRTVEHHLAAVYRKLGVGSRTELMARHPATKNG